MILSPKWIDQLYCINLIVFNGASIDSCKIMFFLGRAPFDLQIDYFVNKSTNHLCNPYTSN